MLYKKGSHNEERKDIFHFSSNIVQEDKEDEVGHAERKVQNCTRVFIQEKRTPGNPENREDTIMGLKTAYVGVDRTHLAQYRVRWRAFVNVVRNLGFREMLETTQEESVGWLVSRTQRVSAGCYEGKQGLLWDKQWEGRSRKMSTSPRQNEQ
jgi:hypothetical protein